MGKEMDGAARKRDPIKGDKERGEKQKKQGQYRAVHLLVRQHGRGMRGKDGLELREQLGAMDTDLCNTIFLPKVRVKAAVGL